MKALGFLLLFAGWWIVLSAIALLPAGAARAGFAGAGMLVELLGLVLAARAHASVTLE